MAGQPEYTFTLGTSWLLVVTDDLGESTGAEIVTSHIKVAPNGLAPPDETPEIFAFNVVWFPAVDDAMPFWQLTATPEQTELLDRGAHIVDVRLVEGPDVFQTESFVINVRRRVTAR